MKKIIAPGFLKGVLQIPASKSYMQRACAAAFLKGGNTTITHIGTSNDDKAAMAIIQELGAKLTLEKDTVQIESNFKLANKSILQQAETIRLNVQESGLGLRMFTPIAALLDSPITISGEGSLLQRPMHFFDEILPELGVHFTSNNGYLPFTVQGCLVPKNITIHAGLSSQFLTGLLMAYSAANENAVISVEQLSSKPYIDITMDVLKSFGLNVPVQNGYSSFTFCKRAEKEPEEIIYPIESDWSSASFFLVGAAINGHLACTGLNLESVQADKKILEALQNAHADVQIEKDKITVQKSNLTGFDFDATDCPDLFPPLVALAANAKGVTRIRGLKRLEHKESNRGLTLQEEFAKLQIPIVLNEDEMMIESNGTVVVQQEQCSSHHDHRIAMTLAIAVLNSNQSITIHHADAVAKSYPGFFEDFAAVYQ